EYLDAARGYGAPCIKVAHRDCALALLISRRPGDAQRDALLDSSRVSKLSVRLKLPIIARDKSDGCLRVRGDAEGQHTVQRPFERRAQRFHCGLRYMLMDELDRGLSQDPGRRTRCVALDNAPLRIAGLVRNSREVERSRVDPYAMTAGVLKVHGAVCGH